eukprot:2843543-Pleurochrysis_carterae.AAC.3
MQVSQARETDSRRFALRVAILTMPSGSFGVELPRRTFELMLSRTDEPIELIPRLRQNGRKSASTDELNRRVHTVSTAHT